MAKNIPQSFIDEILNRSDIVDVINVYVPLKSKGQNFMACCPFHQEKTPSFSVSREKQFFYCFGCKEAGNVITFLMKYEHLTFVETIEKLAHRLGLEVQTSATSNTISVKKQNPLFDIYSKANSYFQYCLRKHLFGTKAIDYLKKRGITGALALEFQLGVAPDGWQNLYQHMIEKGYQNNELLKSGLFTQKSSKIYDRFRARLMFPIRNPLGKILGFGGRVLDAKDTPKYLNSPETSTFIKGEILYGLYEALKRNKKIDSMLVVEGYMDVIALFGHEISNVVATLGTAPTRHHIHTLKRYTNKIVFCFDGDTAGLAASWKALQICLPLYEDDLEIRFCFLPAHHDPDSFIRKHGKDAFRATIERSTSLSDFLFNHLASKYDLQNVDQKAKFISTIIPLIKSIPGTTKQTLMLDKVSRVTHMEMNTIVKEPLSIKTNSRVRHQKLSTIPLLDKILAIFIQNPSSIDKVPEDKLKIFEDTLPQPSHTSLIHILKEHRPQTTGQLLEYCRDTEAQHVVRNLTSLDLTITSEQLDLELDELLEKLNDQSLFQKINQLLTKGNLQGLDNDEMIELNQLILKTKTT